MKTLNFSVHINAPKEKVWQVLWDDETYRKWTSAFGEGSHAVSDWEEGSKVLFLGSPGGDGMFSKIEKKVENEFMSFNHLGVVKGGVEQPETEWAGAKENYTLKDNNGTTDLNVSVDITEDFEKYMTETFPKALDIVRSLCEA